MSTSRDIRGRGSTTNPPNRFIPLYREEMPGWTEEGDPAPRTRFYRDESRTILARNDSPDIPFTYSLNPYRGCEHGCVYCYARPGHEYLGLSAGLDFESRIFVKEDAPELLRRELASPGWVPQSISVSGVTDPYQPIERRLQLTRRCLEVLAAFRNPVGIVTKNALVVRDADVLRELARMQAAMVFVSVTTLDAGLAHVLEPRASAPAARLRAIRQLTDAGIPVGVMTAPIIPGLNDHEAPAILKAAAEAGAITAAYVMIRLPHAVKDLFIAWLERHAPQRKERVLGRIRSLRGGRLNDPRFGSRMRGEGPWADTFDAMYQLHRRRLGLHRPIPKLDPSHFRSDQPRQHTLFDERQA